MNYWQQQYWNGVLDGVNKNEKKQVSQKNKIHIRPICVFSFPKICTDNLKQVQL